MSVEQIVMLGTATVEIRLRNISSRFMPFEEREKLAEASRMIFGSMIAQVDIEIIVVESISIPGYYDIGIVGKFVDSDNTFTIASFTDNLLKSLMVNMGTAASFIMDIGQISADLVQSRCLKDSDIGNGMGLTEEDIIHPPHTYAN